MATTEEATSFLDFQEEFNRSYDTPEELAYRSGVYIDNLNLINANNNNATSNFTMAVNDFSDLTLAEFKAIYLGYTPRRQESSAMENGFMGCQTFQGDANVVNIPTEWDWRSKGGVTPVTVRITFM